MANESSYLVLGEDEFLVSSYAKQLIDELVPESERALKLEIVDGAVDTVDEAVAAMKQCLEALQTVGFFGGGTTVWLRDVLFFGASARTSSSPDVKGLVGALTDLLKKGLADGQILVVSTPKLAKNTALYKTLNKQGAVREFAVSKKAYEQEQQAEQRTVDVAARLGLKFSPAAKAAFLAKVGGDSRLIACELEKLSCYKGEGREVDESDVAAITSTGRDAAAWDLADAFGARDLPKALNVLRQLLFQRESGVRLVLSLNSRVNDLALMREAMDRRWVSVSSGRYTNVNWQSGPEIDALMSAFARDPRKMHSYRQGLLAQQAKRFSLPELRRARFYVLQAHETLVSETVPQSSILELLLLRLIPSTKSAAPAVSRRG